jgi:hypothetical protein
MAEATTSKKFRLSFVNAAEDVPRLIRAYGRACDGEFALVLRPPEERCVLVLVTKKDGSRFWRSTEGADGPAVPAASIAAKDAVVLVKTEQKAVPKPGPITLRGQWSGWMHCDAGVPRVELVRKLAAYGVLRIVSSSTGWTWTVERTEKWFSRPGSDEGTAPTLVKAIEAGLARAMGLLGEACSVRDSRRRAALDSTYATEHPVKPAHEGRDPTERMKVREKAAAAPTKPAGSPWTHFEGEPPEADPIERPTRGMKSAVRKGGFTHDSGAGSFLGRSVVDHATFPAGSLVFRSVKGDGFWMAQGIEPAPRATTRPAAAAARAPATAPGAAEKPRRTSKSKGQPTVDAAKDKALLDAFSAAIATALQVG